MAIKKYLICDNNCKFEGLDKEETLSAIQQAIENGGVQDVDPNEPFITKIKDVNTGAAVKLWIGTEAQFNAIETKDANTLYIYSTDFEANVSTILAELQADITTLQGNIVNIISGSQKVGKAAQADKATNATKINNLELKEDSNGVLKIGTTIIKRKKFIADITVSHNTVLNAISYNIKDKKLLLEIQARGASTEGFICVPIEAIPSSKTDWSYGCTINSQPVFGVYKSVNDTLKAGYMFFYLNFKTVTEGQSYTLEVSPKYIPFDAISTVGQSLTDSDFSIENNILSAKLYEIIE